VGGGDESTFFHFESTHQFSKDIAVESLWFSLACALSFIVGHAAFYRRNNPPLATDYFSITPYYRNIAWINVIGVMMVLYISILGSITGFNYGLMT